jgi:hypothetical protein
MSQRHPACVLAFALATCVPAQPEDTGGRSRRGSHSNGAEDTHTGDADTGDTVAERPCADLPWTQVDLGWDFGCGIHTDGCVECWGSDTLYNLIYREPEVEAQFLAVNDQSYHDYENRDYPSACVIGTDQRLTCWAMHPDHRIHETTEPVVDVAFGEYGDLAVLWADGTMTSQSGSREGRGWIYDPVSDVSAPMVNSSGQIIAVKNGRFVIWDIKYDGLEESDCGPVDVWSWYAPCNGAWCALDHDGGGWTLIYEGEWKQILPAGGGWVAIWGNYWTYLVQDAEGLVYEYDDHAGTLSATPWFSEPMVSVVGVQGASCGITADGWMECTGDMKDRFPPPGSYVLPR